MPLTSCEYGLRPDNAVILVIGKEILTMLVNARMGMVIQSVPSSLRPARAKDKTTSSQCVCVCVRAGMVNNKHTQRSQSF